MKETQNKDVKIEDLLGLLETKEKEVMSIKNEMTREKENNKVKDQNTETELTELKKQIELLKIDLDNKSRSESDLLKNLTDLEVSHSELRNLQATDRDQLLEQKAELQARERDVVRLTEDLVGRDKTMEELRKTIESLEMNSRKPER